MKENKEKTTKDKRIILRMTTAEETELKARAAAAGCSMSEYIRACVFSSKKGIKGKKYCTCGVYVNEKDKFCGNCGQCFLL